MSKRLTLKELKTDVSILYGEVNVIKAEVEELKKEIEELKAKVNSMNADIREILSAYTEGMLAVNTRIDRLEQKMSGRGITQCIKSLLKKLKH
jgi:peptidoglycan hydrolase CwlO-like protein